MKLIKTTALTMTLALATSFNVAQAADDQFSGQQVKEIEKIIHNYLVTNPSVLVDASKALQQQEMQKAQKQAESSISQNFKDLFMNQNSPVMGNPKGSVILVEFMDYQCGYCKRMSPVVQKLIQNNPNLKVVIKEWAILSETSVTAAKAAIASMKQDKFPAFHEALMKADGRLSESSIMDIAKKVGLNVDELKKDMNSAATEEQIRNTYDLAKSLSLSGTPAFLVSNADGSKTEFVPGASTEADLQDLINKVSNS